MKMKSVIDLEGSKIRVHAAIRCAPLCGIGRLMLGVNTNVGFLNLDGLLLADSEQSSGSGASDCYTSHCCPSVNRLLAGSW
jgi:hypothetical protein